MHILRSNIVQQPLTTQRAANAPKRRESVRCFSNADSDASGNGAALTVRFQLPYHAKFGQQLCIVGSGERLGGWDVARGVPMTWTEGDVWVAELTVPPEGGAELTYKYVVRNGKTLEPVRWQEGDNSTLALPAAAPSAALVVRESWDAGHRVVESEGGETAFPAAVPVPEPSAAAVPAPAPTPAPAPARRGRRKKSASSEEAEAVEAIGRAADKALKQLDAAVTASMEMLDSASDPASPELLAADRVVAAAARRATALTKALDAAQGQKLLAGEEGSSAAAAPKGRGRRRAAAKEPAPSSEK